MKKLASLAISAGLLAGAFVVAADGKIEPPNGEELRETRALVEEVFPIANDASRDEVLRVIEDLKGTVNDGDMSAADRYGISIKLEELAIRVGDPDLWASTIDSRSNQFAVDLWTTNSQGMLSSHTRLI